MIILIILIIVLLLSFTYIKNHFKNETTILDDVKLKEEEPNNNGFALMLQKDDGTYEESNSSTWPTNMKFNNELSGCIDVNGNKIDNALSFNTSTNAVMVRVSGTTYCYVYFDIDKSLNNKVVNSSDIWESALEGDGYRYVGTDPSNYICFGTTDKETCLNDTDKYMYRIIGVFNDENGVQHAKLIKKEALNTTYEWNSDYQNDVDWNKSDLYNGLNGSYFLTNTSYPYMQDTTWTDKIATWNYTMTNTKGYENYKSNSVYGMVYYFNTGGTVYLHELNRSSKSNATCYWGLSTLADCNVGEWKNLETKISLMYASDFRLSVGCSTDSWRVLKKSWMYISDSEWTMTRNGANEIGTYNAEVTNASQVFASEIGETDYEGTVRPVFYLESNVEISGGIGTINDPFLLKN